MLKISNLRLKYIKRISNRDIWNNCLKKVSFVKVEFTNEFIDYNIEYLKSQNNTVNDHSYIIISDSIFVGLILNIVAKKNKTNFNNFTYIPIIFTKNINDIKKIILDFDEMIKYLFNNKKINLRYFSQDKVINNIWIKKIYYDHLKKYDEIDILLNLNDNLENIISKFGKSTKWRINQGKRFWRSKIINSADKKSWLEFKRLHLKEAKKLTRSQKSWNIQYKNLSNNKAFLINLYDKKNKIVGGGYFLLSVDEALYGVAAYDHDYFPKPIGHFLQYEAIRYLISKKIQLYRLGSININLKKNKKLESINEFKLSFSSDLKLGFCFEYKI